MGSQPSVVIVDPVRVSRTRPKYPPPSVPKWFLPDIRPLVFAPEIDDIDSRNIDWHAIERSIEQEPEDGVDASKDVELRIRPSSGIGNSRTDSGAKTNRQTKRHGHRKILSFDNIDKHAFATLPIHSASFDELIQYLKKPIYDELHPETCLVRALTVWLSKQDSTKSKYQHADVRTPTGIIQHLRQQTLSYTEAFTLLCRGAGLPTVIITGHVKAGKYEPGDIIDDGARDTWCAVHVDGSWQLVHPKWVCRGTYGKEKDDWVQIEDDPYLAKKDLQRQKEKEKEKEKYILTFNEEFFMPKPEVFIYKCYADEQKWRLIPEEMNLTSLNDFMKLVYISPPFFKLGLSLANNPSCVQKSTNGVVIIEIIAPKDFIHALNLGYQIYAEQNETKHNDLYKNLLQKDILSRLVLNYRSNDRFVFEIRLPLEGNYQFVIVGGFGTDLSNICRFKLVCTESVGEWFVPFLHPGNNGWGPGPEMERVGLLLPTKPSGKLTVSSRQNSGVVRHSSSVFYHLTTLNFQINKALIRKYEYTVEIMPSTFIDTRTIASHFTPNGELKGDLHFKEKEMEREKRMEHVKSELSEQSQDDDLPVRAQYTKDISSRQFTVQVIGNLIGEECAVIIKATEMEIMNNLRVPKKGVPTKIVCYYLLTNASTFFHREHTEVKLCKSALHDAMNTQNIDKIQSAMNKCLKFKVPVTDDAIAAAEARLEYLILRAVVNETLRRVVGYRYREALIVEVEKLWAFRKELQSLEGYPQGLPPMRESIEEMYKLASAKPPVHNTMKALLILLGYEGNLKEWSFIHKQLKVTTDKLSDMGIIRRIEYMTNHSFPWRKMDFKVLQRVYKVVHEYQFEHVKHVSLAAAAIYKWIEKMLKRAKYVLQGGEKQ
ncbi:uncharacterized protein LOC132760265 isoform X2 [Ruditapes philippinarum]|uniref:uncharacterized protein LOC132760265 isoform X2 n=1 Tax=Ruditapes philippinarum TaxID=129788 RepID=UPI00295B1E44|nr:uncharacterized protein LOC132760265 isoform X2 [Ruditapes philippinarum]